MRIRKSITPLLPLLRAGGLNSRVRGWNRTLRALFPLASQSSELVQITYRGRPYAAAPNQYVDWEVLTTGAYEADDIALIERQLACYERPVVLDIGTNVGHHAFAFATMGAEVHGFEPNPALWPIIETKIATAGLTAFKLHRVGLGDKDEQLGFSVQEKLNSGTGHFIAEIAEAEMVLPIRMGDEYLAEIGVSGVDFIKMDVQGFEPQALRGLVRTLERHRPIVCVEIGAENRATIPTLAALEALLPSRYAFRFVGYEQSSILRHARLRTLNAEVFRGFDGNAFCTPVERMACFEEATAS